MKFVPAIVWLSAFSIFSPQALAQFSQPPPERTASTCSLRKSLPAGGGPVSAECEKNGVAESNPILTCGYPNQSDIYCTTRTWVLVAGQWIEIDHSSVIHDWAFIIDGQEYYWSPINQGDVGFSCGNARRGYVRVAVAGGWTVGAFECPAPTNNEW